MTVVDPGQVLCVESVDRLSRLSQTDWEVLKATINSKGLRLVVADLPTSWEHLDSPTTGRSDIAGSVMRVINSMLIDLMATMARLDQEKRVERIRQGMANKRAADPSWKAVGKRKSAEKWQRVEKLLRGQTASNMTVKEIAQAANVGEATVYRIKKELGVIMPLQGPHVLHLPLNL